MSDINFSRTQTELLVSKIKRYFCDEFELEIGGFEAEFLLEFFTKEIGPHCYNQGLKDANRLFSQKAQETGYLIEELEKPAL